MEVVDGHRTSIRYAALRRQRRRQPADLPVAPPSSVGRIATEHTIGSTEPADAGEARALDVLFVVTEHLSHLDAERRRRYEDAAGVLARLAGSPLSVVHYADPDALRAADAVVLSGSDAPWAAHDERELQRLLGFVADCERPVLGICAGMQLLARCAGGTLDHAAENERGFQPIEVLDDRGLLHGLPAETTVYQSHTDEIRSLPEGFRVLARSAHCRVQAIAAEERRFWGTQFHPERTTVEHPDGLRVLRNFFSLVRDPS
ncbi:MAG: gamma-glutamyl-gamma-aminobutyrate hydrolase family protein [Actinomycetota bacterium]